LPNRSCLNVPNNHISSMHSKYFKSQTLSIHNRIIYHRTSAGSTIRNKQRFVAKGVIQYMSLHNHFVNRITNRISAVVCVANNFGVVGINAVVLLYDLFVVKCDKQVWVCIEQRKSPKESKWNSDCKQNDK